MRRERGPDGKWPLTAVLEDAQHRYMALTGARISQAEVQRLQWRLDAGDWPDEASRWCRAFFLLHEMASNYCANFESGKAAQNAYEEFCQLSCIYIAVRVGSYPDPFAMCSG